ncbi:uncharacterized protein HMPREF1541_09319 [Cyphellophora europaea CBS 101466]|uniref:Uncharacterized protein n=1 Tax=Cyphellophora europaea (strain CBS 101466) TaxID=1220924 RepID=W2S9X8_CYPE1|nr:uncharacterized protein HMPREF1541_09319 [Cyphellophora europaea CBS 101466]ETN45487.1 hypothetical protein HMPREF1541_09319 [Cyphellophora europaea CBS 101466]
MQPPLSLVRNIFRRNGNGNSNNDKKKIVFKPYDVGIQSYTARGSLCNKPVGTAARGGGGVGMCIFAMRFQSFAKGELVQECVGREWWVRVGFGGVGSAVVASGVKWEEVGTRKKAAVPSRRW